MMDDDKLRECALYLVQYVPDLVRGEYVNIGVLLHSPEEKCLGCLFTDDFRRIKHFHPQADVHFLRHLQAHFEMEIDEHGADLEGYLQYIRRSYSNLVQVSEPRAFRLTEPQREIQDLFARYVGQRLTGPQPEDTRLRMKQRLTAALSLAGVLELMEKQISAARWTHAGDPFKFDYGYTPLLTHGRPNGHMHFIHAHSLKRDADARVAKALAYTFARVRGKETAELTAVVEALAAPGDIVATFSQKILEEGGIRLQPIAGVENFAQSIRRELMV
jgi:hypothetical protein